MMPHLKKLLILHFKGVKNTLATHQNIFICSYWFKGLWNEVIYLTIYFLKCLN